MDYEVKFLLGIILLIIAGFLWWAGKDIFTLVLTVVVGLFFFMTGGFKMVKEILGL